MKNLTRNRWKPVAAAVAVSVVMLTGQAWAQTVTDDPDVLFPGHPSAPSGSGGGVGAPPSGVHTPPGQPGAPPSCCVMDQPPPGATPPGLIEPAASPF
jgi:hypothetical protein